MMSSWFAIALLPLAIFALPACTSDDGSCERIVEACHELDPGSGPIHDCHEFAEEATDEACVDREDDCLAACH
jgi:hypothetical protein